MAPDPATSKSRGSRYRSNETSQSNRAGDSMERGSQRSESAKGKSEKDGGGAESGRGIKRRQHGDGGTSGSVSSAHRSSKRWRGDVLETLENTIPTDRWDGGGSGPSKENAFPSGKGKHESESRSGEGTTGKANNAQLPKEGVDFDKAARKQKGTKTSLASDNRAITVMDLQETDISIMETNIRIKNKVSHRREGTLELAEPDLEKNIEENAKSIVESSRSRRRWDRDGHKGGTEDRGDEHLRGNVGREESQERDKKKEKSIGRDRDRDADARIQNGRRSGEGSHDLVAEVDGTLEISEELDHSNDFKIQKELRNIELEKELENRIRRRREESGDRDRWRDDDREREGKRHSASRDRDDRTRDERHRSRRDKERHTDRYESRQHREGSKVSEGRQREDRYYESDREYRSYRDDRHHGTRAKDVDDQVRGDRNRDQDHRDRKGRENAAGYEAERRPRDRVLKEDLPERERSYPTPAYVDSSDGMRNEHRHKRVRESDGDGYATERDHSRQRGRPGDSDAMTGSDLVQDDRLGRNREDRDPEGRYERSRGSPRDNDVIRGRSKGNIWRNDGPASEMGGEGLSSPRHDTRGSPSSNRMDYMSSPHLDDQRSPRYHSQRSPSSHIDMSSAASRGKMGHGDWHEPSNSVSTSGGPQRRSQGLGLHMGDRRDRSKWNTGAEEEVKSGIFRVNRSSDEGREGSLSPHRLHDQHLGATQMKPPLHGQDSFPRGMASRGMMEGRSDRGGWRAFSQSGSTGFDSGADHHGPDDLSPRDRNDRLRRMPMNRPPGSPMIRSQGPQGPQLSSLSVPPLAPLPPPPPFRPGIDNPAVLGPLNGSFDDTSVSREQGRGDRKGGPLRRGDPGGGIGPGEGWRGVNIGNWNARNQGPPPGSGFPPFPPQFGHPPGGGGGFPGMGQQFPGPHIFPGGGRPPLDMGFGGGRFLGPGSHMGEGGEGYLGHGRGTGWHGPGEVDDGRGPPLLGPGDGWEGPGPHADDRHRHGRMEWERGGPMGIRGWERERERDMWEARGRDGAPDFIPHRSRMDPPQNQSFPPVGSSWVMQRDAQVSNEAKTRQERQSFDTQEVKRKADGGPPKSKIMKPSSRAVSTNEGKLTKYATATMQSILSQLDISPDLAGPELYAQYQALLPAAASGNKNTFDEQENSSSESADEDLNLEADPEAESLIAGPSLLAKLLPPLPDGVFEEAVRLYRKPETENRVQKSLRGCFVLPFDPSTIKVPSISLKLNRSHSGMTNEQPLIGVHGLLDQLDVDVLHADFGEEYSKTNDELVNIVEQRPDGLELVGEMEAAEIEEREGEAMQEDFISSHVEVAEYSDREFEAEMEDTLEEDSLKEVPDGGALSERLEPVDDHKYSVDNIAVYSESIDPVDTMVHSQDSLTEVVHSQDSLTQVDNNVEVTEATMSEDVVAVIETLADNIYVRSDDGENVNSFVVAKGAVTYDNTNEPEKNYMVEEDGKVWVEEPQLEVINTSETSAGEFLEPQIVQFSAEIREFSPEASVSREVIEAAGDIFGEHLEAKLVTAAEIEVVEAVAAVERVEELKDPEEAWVAESVDSQVNGLDLQEDLSETLAVKNILNHVHEEVLATLLENDTRKETNGKFKEIVESPSAPGHPAVEEPQVEPLTRLRKRRASSRLQAQHSVEAQAVLQQETSDGLVGQGSVGIKKVGSRGTTRASQRRSKRRGSTH